MMRCRRTNAHWVVLTGLIFLLAGTPGAPVMGQEITTHNTARYIGNGQWKWAVYIRGRRAQLREIECVQYILHPTFKKRRHSVCAIGNQRFPFRLRVGFESHAARANLRTRSMTEAA